MAGDVRGGGVLRGQVVPQQSPDVIHEPYRLDTGLLSRSISFENPTGAPGEGGKAASKLGPGRKGAPQRNIKPGESVQLCDIEGPGTIRHIWVTTAHNPISLRALVLRAWWDDQEHPSIECPVGDFFGTAQGKIKPYCSAVHSVGSEAGMNIWLPMPFLKRAKFVFTNESSKTVSLYYQITYTLGDKHREDVGRLHVLFRRENPTTAKSDFELLPERQQKGRYIGSVIGVRNLHPGQWWGEGELKVYMDGDTEHPDDLRHRQRRLRGAFVGRAGNAVPLQRLFPERAELRLDVPLALGRPDCLAATVPDHHSTDSLWEEGPGGNGGRLVVRDLLVRAGAQRAFAADAGRQGPHRRHLARRSADKEVATTASPRRRRPGVCLATLAERPGIADFRRFLLCASVK